MGRIEYYPFHKTCRIVSFPQRHKFGNFAIKTAPIDFAAHLSWEILRLVTGRCLDEFRARPKI